jgi:hypothetical protein
VSGTEVVALDPVRMAGLEAYLRGLHDRCRRAAGQVAEAVASTGVDEASAAEEVAALERLAAECLLAADDVAWRRALVAQVAGGVPATAWSAFAAPAAEAAVDLLVARVQRAVDDHPPTWASLAPALAEVARLRGSEPLSARFLHGIGAGRARSLHALLGQMARSEGGPARERAEALDGLLAAAVRDASRHEGDGALGAGWYASYLGVPPGADLDAVDERLDDERRAVSEQVDDGLVAAGYGADLARRAGRLAGAGWLATAGGLAGGALELARAPVALFDGDGAVCDVPESLARIAAGSVAIATVAAAPTGGTAVVLALVGAAFVGAGALLDRCEVGPPRMAERTLTADPETGEQRYPSGHASNPHVDAAGVPLAGYG